MKPDSGMEKPSKTIVCVPVACMPRESQVRLMLTPSPWSVSRSMMKSAMKKLSASWAAEPLRIEMDGRSVS